jgi:hypothetical protein
LSEGKKSSILRKVTGRDTGKDRDTGKGKGKGKGKGLPNRGIDNSFQNKYKPNKDIHSCSMPGDDLWDIAQTQKLLSL